MVCGSIEDYVVQISRTPATTVGDLGSSPNIIFIREYPRGDEIRLIHVNAAGSSPASRTMVS